MSRRSERRKRQEQERQKRGAGLIWAGLALAAALMLFAGYRLISVILEYREAGAEYQELTQYAPTGGQLEEVAVLAENAPFLAAIEGQSAGANLPLMNFSSLSALNEDSWGWLTIPDTAISYPVVQGEDLDYYRQHTFLRRENRAGALFLSIYNTAATDFNHVIYGHNLKNGSMFHDLTRYQEEGFFREHRYGLLYTPERTYALRAFAAYEADVNSGYDRVVFASQQEREAYYAQLAAWAPRARSFPVARSAVS